MDHDRTVDADSDLSFEALTFGDNGDQTDKVGGRQFIKKKDKAVRKKVSKKDQEGGEKSTSVYISTQDEKLDVQPLLRKLEQFGAVRGYYFKEKANFGIVQFVDHSVVDAVIDHFDSSDLGFQVTVERTSRTKEAHASPHSFGSMPANTPTIPSTPPPPEKPDTILVLKNLPFTLKQDQLHEILLSLSTTIPQSISLHYDNAGVFRGMAFIKYRQLDDAIQVYELLNGMDVGGRKVRVEYKRKPAGSATVTTPKARPLADIPVEWQEDEELRRLWEQLKDFKDDPNQSEWYYPNNLTINQRRNIYNMSDRLKLVQGTAGENEVRVLFLRKGPNPSPAHLHPNSANDHQYSSSADKTRGIDIKGRRPRNDSDPRGGGSSPNSVGGRSIGNNSVGNSSVGRNEGNKTIASSAPADMNLDWRNNPSTPNSASTHNHNNNNTAHLQVPIQNQLPLVAPMRQPKGPDGSKGFGTSRKLTVMNTCTFLAPSAEVIVA